MYTRSFIFTCLFNTVTFFAMATECQTVNTEVLKSWYEQNIPMTILEARTKCYFDYRLLPNALWLPHNSPEKVILSAIPDKDALVVVYCWSKDCPASNLLAERLTAMGYTQVIEYQEGFKEWEAMGYPIIEL